MKPIEFRINCGSGTVWKCRVIIHPNKKALLKARGGKNCQAFCFQLSDANAHETGDNAILHFERGNLNVVLVAHEVAHAAVAFAGRCRIDFNTEAGDEWFADCVEYLMNTILYKLKQHRVKIKTHY